MKRTILVNLAAAAMAIIVIGWAGMANTAQAQGCASCGAAPADNCGAPCGACDTCGPCAHPLLAAPLVPIRFLLGVLGGEWHCDGCGCETYYGDDWCGGSCGNCCEPCDRCGNYIGGCGRCGPGGIRGALFGGGTVGGGPIIDEPMSGGTVSNGGMVIGNPSYNPARGSGTCPTCGRSYTSQAPAVRSNANPAGYSGNRSYPVNASYNNGTASYRGSANYSSGSANYRGNTSYSNANYSNNGNYSATRTSYSSPQRAPSPQVDLSTLPPGRFSPKVVSVTDEVVSPATSGGDDAQAARSRNTTAR